MDLDLSVFLGTFYPTNPILSHSEPIYIMISSFLLLIYMPNQRNRVKSLFINLILHVQQIGIKLVKSLSSQQSLESKQIYSNKQTNQPYSQRMAQKVQKLRQIKSPFKTPTIIPQTQTNFNVQSIIQSIQKQQDIQIKHLHAQFKEFQIAFKQIYKEVSKLKKQIQFRPTSHALTQNTILITTSVHSDPNIIKLLHSREDRERYTEQTQEIEQNNPSQQLKSASLQLGKKISQVNDSLPLLLGMIKALEKQTNSQISQFKTLIEEKTHSLQDQLNQLKIQEISERLALTEKLESQYETTQQKQRVQDTKMTWQLKDLKMKLHEKVSKQTFETALQQNIQENKKTIAKFQQESISLVNPEKIKEIQTIIQANRQNLMKSVVQCNMNIDSLTSRIEKELVNIDFYKKQRTSLEKRISNINFNFEEIHSKVSQLKVSSDDYLQRIKTLENDNSQKTKTMQQMRTILINLSITEEFQKMLSQIDPQKILALEGKIQNLQAQSRQFYRMFDKVNQEIDKIKTKFQVDGILVPNKSRQKDYHLQDLRQIIDHYLVQNRFGSKISRMEAEINEGRTTIETVKLMDKKISRIQKESNFGHVLNEFKLLEQRVKKDLKIIEQKMQNTQSQNQVSKSYFQGLVKNLGNRRSIPIDVQNDQLRRRSLVSEASQRLVQTRQQKGLSYRSSSLRKIIPWETGAQRDNQLHSSFIKNTISSTKKNLMKSNDLLIMK